MAITRVASEYSGGDSTMRGSGAQSLTNITIPATSEFAILVFSFYDDSGGGNHPTTVTLDGNSATHIVSGDSSTAFLMCSMYYAPITSSGASKTLSWTNPVGYEAGIKWQIAFYSGGDISSGTTSLVRSSGSAQHGTSATTASLAGNSGDYAINGYFNDVDDTPTWTPATEFFADGPSALAEYSPTGASTYNVASIVDGAIVAAVLIPSGGGGAAYNAVPVLEYYQTLNRRAVFH